MDYNNIQYELEMMAKYKHMLIFLFKKLSMLPKPCKDPWEESLALLVTSKEQQQHTVEEDET